MNAFLASVTTVLQIATLSIRLNLLPLASFAQTTQIESTRSDDLRLVPFPKSVTLETRRFLLQPPLILGAPESQKADLGRLLNDELRRAGLGEASIVTLDSAFPSFRLAAASGALVLPPLPQKSTVERPGQTPAWATPKPLENYGLHVRPKEIVCAAEGPAGLILGIQTLCQLIRANREADTIPCLQILDWPSLTWRGFQDDLTRGPSSTLDTLKFEASLASYLKLNLMTYYMEYQFTFRNHPNIGPPNGSLTPAELSALVDYARPLHLEILGNQQSFGHFGRILEHPQYAALRETPDVLCPVREESYQLLDDLYSEVCPLLPFPWFNVCCDETEGLGIGPSRDLAAKIGIGGVYVQHMRRIHDLLRDKYQKRMMMWGDIILQHPANLKDIPRDTIMLSWGYDDRPSFEEQIIPFVKSGYEFFVCPGVSDWNRILPDFGVAITNIHHFIRDGVKHGALGIINTDWEDDGEALKAVKWHADAWAAECAWNGSATSFETFNRRLGAVLFGESGDHFGQAVALLMQTHRLPAMKNMFNARFWEADFVPKARPAAIQATASNLLARVRPALEHLQACRREATCNQHVIDVFLFGAQRMELVAQRMLDGLDAAQHYEHACTAASSDPRDLAQVEQLVRKNREAHQSLGRQFTQLWLAESKPYALDWTLSRYTNAVDQSDALLAKLDAARRAAGVGQSLPAPEDFGLATPQPVFRRVRSREILTEDLSPGLPWAESSSIHRLGLVVHAGSVDRFNLPVEVELTLPGTLVGQPARAFVISSNAQPREIPAQLDALATRGKSRLLLVLPGPLFKGQQTAIHVYLGTTASATLPISITTTPGTNGGCWIENDQIRLLLGPEGAHVYRWELKPAGSRDLTMPGESDWAGFSDIHSHRTAHYQLNCRARGPAMVEFECSDPWGDTKLIRSYAGAAWIEVLLGEPTSVYWDFDDPRNFASDGPTPGSWLFSDGQSGRLGRQADGVSAQVKSPKSYWGIKFNSEKIALGLVTPETAAAYVIAPGAGAGGVGIEGSATARHFVTFAGVLSVPPAETMNRLRATLDLTSLAEVQLYRLQRR